MVGWLVGWLVGCLVGWVIGYLVTNTGTTGVNSTTRHVGNKGTKDGLKTPKRLCLRLQYVNQGSLTRQHYINKPRVM